MSHNDKIKDCDAFFEVDPITRKINNMTPAKIVLMQGDHNSEKFTFSLPRYIEGHDMAESARAKLHYMNTTKADSGGMYEMTDLKLDEDNAERVKCSWLISANVTKEPGAISFLVEFECYEGNVLVYSWHTAPFTGISIGETFDFGEEIAVQYADVLEQWEQRLFDANSQAVKDVETAKAEALQEVENAGSTLFANPFKATASGEVVRVDDVSPLEHTAKVKVYGKNLADISKVVGESKSDNEIIQKEGNDVIFPAIDGNVYGFAINNADVGFEVGKVYTASVGSVSAYDDTSYGWRMRYADGTVAKLNNGLSCTFVIEKEVEKLVFRIGSPYKGNTESRITEIQLEEGDTATVYEPFIDPTTVTVTRAEKNLIPPHEKNTQNGYTATKNSDGSVTVIGSSTTDGAIYLNLSAVTQQHLMLKKGKLYSVSWSSSNGRNGYMKLVGVDGENKWVTIAQGQTILDGDIYAKVIQLYVQIGASTQTDPNSVGDTSLCGTYYFQVEAGDKKTDFAPYKEPTSYTPNTGGTLEIPSVSPTMTLLTDIAGVTIDLEYNQDTNKAVGAVKEDIRELDRVVAELIEDIGTVNDELEAILAGGVD